MLQVEDTQFRHCNNQFIWVANYSLIRYLVGKRATTKKGEEYVLPINPKLLTKKMHLDHLLMNTNFCNGGPIFILSSISNSIELLTNKYEEIGRKDPRARLIM